MKKGRRQLARGIVLTAFGVPALSERATATAAISLNYPSTNAERLAKVVPASYDHPPGSFCRYGADPSGVADSAGPINDALRCNKVVFDDYSGVSTYTITKPLYFRTVGQILKGQGMGDKGGGAGTTIRFVGSMPGPMVSVGAGVVNLSECALRDLLLDGNGMANVGVEAYDDKLAGGSWRVRMDNVAVLNISAGRDATAIYLGRKDAPNFSNDMIITGCYISNCGRGVFGAGSLYQVHSTTFVGCTDAAVIAGTGDENSASAWTFDSCVFSSNNRDFDGFHISQASFSGCWFENSRLGIYRAASAHSVSFVGCYLHTFNSLSMMDFGNSAGYHFLGGNFVPAGTRSIKIVNVNPTASGAVFGQPLDMRLANDVPMPLVISPATAGSAASRSVCSKLNHGDALSLELGRGCFNVTLSVWNIADPKVRTQASYTAFLFDGDNEGLTKTAAGNGSHGPVSYSLHCEKNKVTFNYEGLGLAMVYLVGTGVSG